MICFLECRNVVTRSVASIAQYMNAQADVKWSRRICVSCFNDVACKERAGVLCGTDGDAVGQSFAGRYCGRELPRKIWLASNGSGGQCWGTDGNARLNYVALIWGICLRYVSLRQVPVLGTTDACFSRRAGNSTVLGHWWQRMAWFKAGGGGESSYDSSASIAGDACWIPDPDGDLSTNAGSRKFVEYVFF